METCGCKGKGKVKEFALNFHTIIWIRKQEFSRYKGSKNEINNKIIVMYFKKNVVTQ
jgi:hypothetical protein